MKKAMKKNNLRKAIWIFNKIKILHLLQIQNKTLELVLKMYTKVSATKPIRN